MSGQSNISRSKSYERLVAHDAHHSRQVQHHPHRALHQPYDASHHRTHRNSHSVRNLSADGLGLPPPDDNFLNQFVKPESMSYIPTSVKTDLSQQSLLSSFPDDLMESSQINEYQLQQRSPSLGARVFGATQHELALFDEFGLGSPQIEDNSNVEIMNASVPIESSSNVERMSTAEQTIFGASGSIEAQQFTRNNITNVDAAVPEHKNINSNMGLKLANDSSRDGRDQLFEFPIRIQNTEAERAQLMELVKRGRVERWLHPQEIYDVLRNISMDKLLQAIVVKDTVQRKPQSSSMFFFRKAQVKFRKDGHEWMRRADGKSVREDHAKLKVNGKDMVYSCYSHLQAKHSFHRRIYWLLSGALPHPEGTEEDPLIMVHYLDTESVPTENLKRMYSGLNACDSGEVYSRFTKDPNSKPLQMIKAETNDVVGVDEKVRAEIKSFSFSTFKLLDYCPKWAPAEVMLIGDWEAETVYECIFNNTHVPTQLIRDGVLTCQCPALRAGSVVLQVRNTRLNSFSEKCSFDVKDVIFPSTNHSADASRSNSNRMDAIVDMDSTSRQLSEAEKGKDLRDISWQDFVHNRFSDLQISGTPNAGKVSSEEGHHEYKAARTIQHAFKNFMDLQRKKREEKKAVSVIEDSYKRYREKKAVDAAVKIQSKFRAHKQRRDFLMRKNAVQVFEKYYRGLRRSDR